jgi:hypothetical protein
MLCKKHVGAHETQNTHDCRHYNKDGTPEGVNFAQIFQESTPQEVYQAQETSQQRLGK